MKLRSRIWRRLIVKLVVQRVGLGGDGARQSGGAHGWLLYSGSREDSTAWVRLG